MVNDLNQGAIPALLPFLIARHGLSYAAAAAIVFAFTFCSTISQPFFGYLADRFERSRFIPAGLFMAGTGLAFTGIVPTYGMLILMVMISGTGSAAFHPEAARYVNYSGGENKATAMSVFGVGGTLGFALGPLLITSAVLAWDLRGTLVVLIPAGFTAAMLITQSPRLAALRAERKYTGEHHGVGTRGKDDWSSFSRLSLTIVGKSILFYVLITFIPLYWIHVLHQPEETGALALSIFSLSGVFGNLLGGRLADRFGHVRVIITGCALLMPCLPALVWTNNVNLATLLLVPVGAFLLMTYGPTIIMGQSYLPNHIGFSSGMTLGVAFSIGGMAAPLLGAAADHYGIRVALASITVIPVLITGVAFTLPSPAAGRA
jgi:FSR family fosmidomycin resistance protein-like MFS transporter